MGFCLPVAYLGIGMEWTNLFCKELRVNNLSFTGHMVSVAATQCLEGSHRLNEWV